MFAPIPVSLYDNANVSSLSTVPVPTLYENILLLTNVLPLKLLNNVPWLSHNLNNGATFGNFLFCANFISPS